VSPAVGELDEDAVSEMLRDDADAALGLIATLTSAADDRLRALARRLAAQLLVDLAVRGPRRRRGATRLATVAYGAGGGDVDVDASLDAVVEARAADAAVDVERVRLRAWTTPATAWCLLVDHSGSMAGRALATAGLAAAAVAARADPADVAVLSFARSVVAVSALADRHDPGQVVDRVLALRGHGTTDLAAALRAAAAQLAPARASRRVTVLLSDCRPTEPGDVIAAATALDELIIVAPAGDSDEAERLARDSGARWATVAGPADVVPTFDAVLDRHGP
jgi:hypothetical protein